MKFIRYEYPTGLSFGDFGRLVTPSFPTADVEEDADNYNVRVELPGVKKEDIKVELENSMLTVFGRRAAKGKEGETTTEFSRSLTVPEGVDTSKVNAAYENGVLTLTLPKLEASKPRQIDVK